MTTDPFTEAARAEADRKYGDQTIAIGWKAIFLDAADWARAHLAAHSDLTVESEAVTVESDEPTDAEVEAAAEAMHYAQGFDDWGVANSYEREEARGLARAALTAARAAGRTEA